MLDETIRRVHVAVLVAVADAYGSPVGHRPAPCSLCGTPSPAARPDECDDPRCPLEGDTDA